MPNFFGFEYQGSEPDPQNRSSSFIDDPPVFHDPYPGWKPSAPPDPAPLKPWLDPDLKEMHEHPDESGEQIEEALAAHRPDLAMKRMAEMKREFHPDAQGEQLVRAAMRTSSPAVKEYMKSVVAGAKVEGPMGPQVANNARLDADVTKLDHSEKDPAWGTLYANYFDRPKAAVSQLLGEANAIQGAGDDKKLKAQAEAQLLGHAGSLHEMMRESPAATHQFVPELLSRHDGNTPLVGRLVGQELNKAVQPGHLLLGFGADQWKEGGPQAEAERLLPLLGQTISQPGVATSLVELQGGQEGEERLGGKSGDLRAELATTLDRRWTRGVRDSVRRSVVAGTSDQLDAAKDDADFDRAGTFLGTAGAVNRRVGVDQSLEKTAAQLVSCATPALPGGLDKAAPLVSKALEQDSAQSQDEDWARSAFAPLVYGSFKKRHPPPANVKEGDEESRKYGKEFREFQKGTAKAFNDALEKQR